MIYMKQVMAAIVDPEDVIREQADTIREMNQSILNADITISTIQDVCNRLAKQNSLLTHIYWAVIPKTLKGHCIKDNTGWPAPIDMYDEIMRMVAKACDIDDFAGFKPPEPPGKKKKSGDQPYYARFRRIRKEWPIKVKALNQWKTIVVQYDAKLPEDGIVKVKKTNKQITKVKLIKKIYEDGIVEQRHYWSWVAAQYYDEMMRRNRGLKFGG